MQITLKEHQKKEKENEMIDAVSAKQICTGVTKKHTQREIF